MQTPIAPAARAHTPGWSTVLHRWPSALGLAAAAVQMVTGADREGVAIVVGVAVLCYLGAAALDRPWIAWAAVLGASVVVTASKLIGVPWWVGVGIVSLILVAAGAYGGAPRRPLIAQSLALVGFGGAAVAALYVAPRVGLALAGVALAAHAVWDLVHYRRNRVVPRSLAEFCMLLDVPLGTGAIVLAITG